MPVNPKLALHYLTTFHGNKPPTFEAQIVTALIYHSNPTFINRLKFKWQAQAIKKTVNALQKRAPPSLSDYIALDDPAPIRNNFDILFLLHRITFHTHYTIPCWVFKRFPHAAYDAFEPYHGDRLDDRTVIDCASSSNVLALPRVKPFFSIVDEVHHSQDLGYEGADVGTIVHMWWASARIAQLKINMSPQWINQDVVDGANQVLAKDVSTTISLIFCAVVKISMAGL